MDEVVLAEELRKTRDVLAANKKAKEDREHNQEMQRRVELKESLLAGRLIPECDCEGHLTAILRLEKPHPRHCTKALERERDQVSKPVRNEVITLGFRKC